ncbi:4-hydroxy-tetrahydrodipicolinate synthase [Plasticicumulans acidivorans]|uniref:4-hydroxy-tetrahydrodipicolinate synthase n=1 Tax=Plasticicumulans acidivorans TaxID=886464 RepID=A0A317MQB2_9GAMM|nr:4-hydroxy-tetrahydrodipicolinate synthase [Plasticicumulans acidivorans]PWV58520.1 dihydrodipicolinate synthase [Plasticicumulans acidivorans]
MFHGSMVALVTPMAADGTLDFDALARLVEFHIENGTDAIVAVGTTGESATLDVDEHVDVVHRVVRQVAGRIPVIAGTGANSTREAIDLTRLAMEAGADACLLVTPYYNKPTQEGLYLHYRAIAEAVPIPQILYNVPGRTACDMLPDTVSRLADIPNIVGLKEASGSLERNRELLSKVAGRIDLYSGDDHIACESILEGFRGVISVTANVAPRAMHEMCVAAAGGDRAAALAINEDLVELHKNLFIEANPIPAKWALMELGLIPPGIRLPLTPLSTACHDAVRNAMRRAHLI